MAPSPSRSGVVGAELDEQAVGVADVDRLGLAPGPEPGPRVDDLEVGVGGQRVEAGAVDDEADVVEVAPRGRSPRPGIRSMIVPSSTRSEGNGASPRRHSSTRTPSRPANRGRTRRACVGVADDEHEVVEGVGGGHEAMMPGRRPGAARSAWAVDRYCHIERAIDLSAGIGWARVRRRPRTAGPGAPGAAPVLESRVVGALASPHGIDHYLVTAGAVWATACPPARIVAVAHATPGTVTLTLRPGAGWAGHMPGQHVALSVSPDGARRTRCFSISSSPHRAEGLIELTIKANGTGGVSDHLVRRSQVGDLVGLSAAAGEFVLPVPRPAHVVLVSAGSGITPVLSMLRALADEEATAAVSFLHYARTPGDVIAAADLAAIADRRPDWRVVIAHTAGGQGSTAGDGSRSPTGRFRAAHLEALLPGACHAPAWVCGPAGLAEAVEAAWRDAGSAAPVHVERYQLGLARPGRRDGRTRPLHGQRRRGSRRRPPPARCRPRPAGSPRPTAAGRGSATPASGASPPARCATCARAT